LCVNGGWPGGVPGVGRGGAPAAGARSLELLGGKFGVACPDPVDSTRPKIVTTHPCRCTRSAPGSAPRLLILPVSLTVRSQPAMIEMGPPPGAWLAPVPPIVPTDSTNPS